MFFWNYFITGFTLLLALLLSLSPLKWIPFSYHHPISSHSALAQYFFNRGFLHLYGFDDDGAYRLFQTASQFDANCAICYWGMAATAPHPDLGKAALGQAKALLTKASPLEQAYIQALSQRYNQSSQAADLAYAQALRQVTHTYPQDLDAAILFTQMMLAVSEGQIWQNPDVLSPIGQELLDTVNAVLSQAPYHPGALHFYLHLVEEQHPEWGLTAADRLRNLRLPVGHLRHMPAHIYLKLGQYRAAISANQAALAIDGQSVIGQPHSLRAYLHYLHHYYFLWYSALQAGWQSQTWTAAAEVVTTVQQDPDLSDLIDQPSYGMLQHYLALPLYTLVRFQRWPQILAAPAPAGTYPTGVWHFARGMAFVHQQEWSKAAVELTQLQGLIHNPALDGVTLWNQAEIRDVLQVGTKMLGAELAQAQDNVTEAQHLLAQAVAQAQVLARLDPPAWPLPLKLTRRDFHKLR